METPRKSSNIRKHHWLFAAKLVFAQGEHVGTREMNAIRTSDKQLILRKDIGKVQEAVQIRFMKETFPEQIPTDFQIVDVVILGATYLGHMSEDDFNFGFTEAQARTEQAVASARSRLLDS